MPWLVALIALVGLVQTVVWIGQPSAPAGRRMVGVFVAPLCVVLLALAVAAARLPALAW